MVTKKEKQIELLDALTGCKANLEVLKENLQSRYFRLS